MVILFVFFFNDTATTEIYTLSLHDALPIYRSPSTRSYNNMSTVPPSNNNNQLGVPLVHHGGRGSGRSGSGASGGAGGAGGYETDDSVFARGSLLPAGAYEDHGGGV